jgi:hypothetical protein
MWGQPSSAVRRAKLDSLTATDRPDRLHHPIHHHLPHLLPSLVGRDVSRCLRCKSLNSRLPCNHLLLRSDPLFFLRVYLLVLHFITLIIKILFKPLRTPHAGPVHVAAVDHNVGRMNSVFRRLQLAVCSA